MEVIVKGILCVLCVCVNYQSSINLVVNSANQKSWVCTCISHVSKACPVNFFYLPLHYNVTANNYMKYPSR